MSDITVNSSSRRTFLKTGLGSILAAGLAPQFLRTPLLGANAP